MRSFLAFVVACSLLATACSVDSPGVPASGAATPSEAALSAVPPGSATSATTDVAAQVTTDEAAVTPSALSSEEADNVVEEGRTDDERKSARRAAFEQLRRTIYANFVERTNEIDPTSRHDEVAFTGSSDDTARVRVEIERVSDEEALVIDSVTTGPISLSYFRVPRPIYLDVFAEAYPGRSPGDADDDGLIEGIAAREGAWNRGLTTAVVPSSFIELDPERWYAGRPAVGYLNTPVVYGDLEYLLSLLTAESVSSERNPDGGTTTTFEMRIPRLIGELGVIPMTGTNLDANGSAWFDADDRLERLDIVIVGDPAISRVTMTVERTPGRYDVPRVDAPLAKRPLATFDTRHYSWSATGSSTEASTGQVTGPWKVAGRVHDGFYGDEFLSMTAADAAVLGKIDNISVPPDHEVRRWGFGGRSTATGLFPELLPEWVDHDEVNIETRYTHDPFHVPADLFPHGLSDVEQWIELRSVPTFVELDGWLHHRVTTGRVDPGYWNYRHGQREGFFAWVASEHPDEEFTVTIGAGPDGRIERLLLSTADPDGGSVEFDIRIDALNATEPGIEWNTSTRPGGALPVDPRWSPSPATDDPDATLATLVDSSRADYPAFHGQRMPLHLTFFLTRVSDDPSGAYSPDGPHHRWPYEEFADLPGTYVEHEGEQLWVTCAELDDSEWRFETNEFERFWRGHEDGGALDGVVLRLGTNGWYLADVYATDGVRHPGDPCRELLGLGA